MGQTVLSGTHRTWVRFIWDGMDMVGLGLQDLGNTMKDLERDRFDLGDKQSQYQLPTGRTHFGLKSFLIFPMLIFPMKVIEARQCLPEFIESVVKAIQSMHQQPLQRAHLDIRLENICFRQLGSAFTGEIITNRLVE